MINNVHISVIPHSDQAYKTVGNWIIKENNLDIFVSDTGYWVFNMAIALHELVEALICHTRGISQSDVDRFDIQYEKDRMEGNKDEPGDEVRAPYHLEHGFATSAERMFIAATEENWKQYEDAVNNLH